MLNGREAHVVSTDRFNSRRSKLEAVLHKSKFIPETGAGDDDSAAAAHHVVGSVSTDGQTTRTGTRTQDGGW